MTTSQAAEELGIGVQQVRKHIKAGRLKATLEFSVSNHLYYEITEAALDKFIHPDGPNSSRPTPGNPTF